MNLMITRVNNSDKVRKRKKGQRGRLLVTPTMLRALRDGLKQTTMPNPRKRLILVVAIWCWSCSIRIHEILARNPRSFDPRSNLLSRDVSI